jgi:hypothetical protein
VKWSRGEVVLPSLRPAAPRLFRSPRLRPVKQGGGPVPRRTKTQPTHLLEYTQVGGTLAQGRRRNFRSSGQVCWLDAPR